MAAARGAPMARVRGGSLLAITGLSDLEQQQTTHNQDQLFN